MIQVQWYIDVYSFYIYRLPIKRILIFIFYLNNPYKNRLYFKILPNVFLLHCCQPFLYMYIFIKKKKDFIIEKQIPRQFVQYIECLSIDPPFYATQIINPFLNSRISTNNDKGQGFQPIVKYLYPLMFLQCIISFICIHIIDSQKYLEFLFVYIHMSFFGYIYPSIHLSKSFYSYIYLFIYLSIYIYISNNLSMYISKSIHIHQTLFVSTYLSKYLSKYLSFYLSTYLTIYLWYILMCLFWLYLICITG